MALIKQLLFLFTFIHVSFFSLQLLSDENNFGQYSLSVFKSDLYAKVDIQSVTGLALFPENIKGNYSKFISSYKNLNVSHFMFIDQLCLQICSSIVNFYHTFIEFSILSSKKQSFLFNFCPLKNINIQQLLNNRLLSLNKKQIKI